MTIKHALVTKINSALRKVDAEITRASEMDRVREQYALFGDSRQSNSLLPEEVRNYLRLDNPRLNELISRYSSLRHPASDHSYWTDRFVRNQVSLQSFRADSAYLWDSKGLHSELSYILTTYYIQTIDELGLLGKLEEDDLFGVYTFDFNGKLRISRDLT